MKKSATTSLILLNELQIHSMIQSQKYSSHFSPAPSLSLSLWFFEFQAQAYCVPTPFNSYFYVEFWQFWTISLILFRFRWKYLVYAVNCASKIQRKKRVLTPVKLNSLQLCKQEWLAANSLCYVRNNKNRIEFDFIW